MASGSGLGTPQKKPDFIVDEKDVHQMIPIAEEDYDYGFKMMDAYIQCFNMRAIGAIFEFGVIGFCCGEQTLKGKALLDNIVSSGMYSRPEDHHTKLSPHLSGGQFIKSKVTFNRGEFGFDKKQYDTVRLQGDLALLCHADWPDEGRGSVAVSVLNNLAIQGYVPRKRKALDGIVLDSVKLAVMEPDEKHKEPWYAAEFDFYVHKDCASYVPLPYDNKTGYVPLDFIEECVREKYG